MKRMDLWAGLVSIFVLGAWVVQAQENPQPQPVKESTQTTGSPSQDKVIPKGALTGSQACSLCFTCGGAYPIFSGGLRVAADMHPQERGAECADPIQEIADTFPFLCCAF